MIFLKPSTFPNEMPEPSQKAYRSSATPIATDRKGSSRISSVCRIEILDARGASVI